MYRIVKTKDELGGRYETPLELSAHHSIDDAADALEELLRQWAEEGTPLAAPYLVVGDDGSVWDWDDDPASPEDFMYIILTRRPD